MNLNDPSGLEPASLLFLGGMALGGTLAAGGIYGSAWAVDRIGSAYHGKRTDAAVNAINKIIPYVVATVGLPTLPAVISMGQGAITSAGRYAGAAISSSRYGPKIMEHIDDGLDFIESAVGPNPLEKFNPWTIGGAALGKVNDFFD